MPRLAGSELRRNHARPTEETMRRPHGSAATRGARLRTLFQALRQHDAPTAEHCLRVRRYALWVADALNLNRSRRRNLSLAAYMHDIGKICLPLSILAKPGKLLADEYLLVQEHPVISERILRPFLPHAEALAAIRWHHERPDGRGYPDGLRGAQIPLAARVLAVADAFDAMTSTRPYRQALPRVTALEMLRLGAGSQFDAEVVGCFIAVLQKPPEDRDPCHLEG